MQLAQNFVNYQKQLLSVGSDLTTHGDESDLHLKNLERHGNVTNLAIFFRRNSWLHKTKIFDKRRQRNEKKDVHSARKLSYNISIC